MVVSLWNPANRSGHELTTKFVLDVNPDNVVKCFFGCFEAEQKGSFRVEITRPAVESQAGGGLAAEDSGPRSLSVCGLRADAGCRTSGPGWFTGEPRDAAKMDDPSVLGQIKKDGDQTKQGLSGSHGIEACHQRAARSNPAFQLDLMP